MASGIAEVMAVTKIIKASGHIRIWTRYPVRLDLIPKRHELNLIWEGLRSLNAAEFKHGYTDFIAILVCVCRIKSNYVAQEVRRLLCMETSAF